MLEKTKGKAVKTDECRAASGDKGPVFRQSNDEISKLYATPCHDRRYQGCMKARS